MCNNAQEIRRGIDAFNELREKTIPIENIEWLIDNLVDIANALHKNFKNPELEHEMWNIYHKFNDMRILRKMRQATEPP